MKRKVARLRLSPNEEAKLIRDEHERRRKLRIQQVREQERYIALQIRREVNRRREHEIQILAVELKQDWERQQKEKLETLHKLYQESLQLLGEGHRSAKENEPDWEAIAQKHEENHNRAAERYHNALKELKSQRQKEQEEQNRFIQARKKAVQVEKMRAAKVANLPPHPPNPIESIPSKKLVAVKKSDVDAFSVTHYHMPETAVDREVDTRQPSAQQLAEQEMRRLQELAQEEQAEHQEQLEKARLRGNHALRVEQLTQDRDRFLVELEHMQQTELLRRRQVVSQMPAQIFQPLYKRQEVRDDWQRDMEFAFEDMYTGERRVKGDLVLQLVPEPLPAMSTDSQDQELDLTLEDVPSAATPLEVTPGDQQGHGHDSDHQVPAAQRQEEPSSPGGGARRQALRKLLNRIRTQKGQCGSGGVRNLPTERQTSDQDMTIDTGSLGSEEKERPVTSGVQPSESRQAPPHVLETTEESIVAGTLLHPDTQANRIHTFKADRKKREEELERQKQDQLALLQELEEQKATLELLLQEAHQERQQLQAAVEQHDTAVGPIQEVPVHDQEVTSGTPPPAVDPASRVGEDTQSRKIREYQQRLLEQNRLHKQSVEQARLRLEDYQRALRYRYNITLTATQAARGPLNPICPPPLNTGRATLPAVSVELPSGSAMPLLPVALTTHSRTHSPMEIPNRESAILPQPSILPVPGMHTRAGSGFSTKVSSVPLTVTTESSRNQHPDHTAWLTDHFLQRVSAHLPDGLRPPPTPSHPPSSRPPATLGIPVPSVADPVQALHPTPSEHPATFPEEASAKPGTFLPGFTQTGKLFREEIELERQRQEVQEAQRRVQGQREALLLQQREQEEDLREQWRRQKEALDALLSADTQPNPEIDDDATCLENIETDRLTLMATLLRAIEQSDSHGPSSVEAHQNKERTAHLQPPANDPAHQSDRCHGPAPPSHPHAPRAPKPPVARARPGVMEMMRMEQHELSAIQEVETPANGSLVTEETARLSLPGAVGVSQEQEPPAPPDRGPPSSSKSSREEPSAGIGTGSGTGTGSGRSSKLSWRDRLRLEAGASPEPDPGSAHPEQMSQNSSDSGRGGLGYFGPGTSSFKPHPEVESVSLHSAHRPSEPDGLSSTTISSGSYVTTEPDHSSTHIDMSLLFAGFGEGLSGRGGATPDDSSSSRRSSSYKEVSPPASPATAASPLHNSSIQRIIDKYTRELNISLNTTGSPSAPSVCERASLEDPSSLRSQQALPVEEGAMDDTCIRLAGSLSTPPDMESAAQGPQDWDETVNRILARISDHSSSLPSRPSQTTGQLSDWSSCADTDKGGDSDINRMIGHPSAQSSSLGDNLEADSTASQIIGQFSGQTTSVGGGQGWDSTLSRMIGRLSTQSSSQWLSGGRDFYASQLISHTGLEQSSLWLDEGQDESRMRPLVAELDESAAQGNGSSGGDGSNHPDREDQGGLAHTPVPSSPERPSEAQADSSAPPGPESLDQALQPLGSPHEQDRTGDSFHPLLPEITHNETGEPSLTFHLPQEEEEPSSSEGSQPSSHVRQLDFSQRSEEPSDGDLDTQESPSCISDHSSEQMRTEELSLSPPSLQDSLYQLTTSQCHPLDSASVVSPAAEEAGLTALSLSALRLCEEEPAVDLPPERTDIHMESVLTPQKVPEVFKCAVMDEDLGKEDGTGKLLSDTMADPPTWERLMDIGGEKGILEESQLTLVSLTDTTLQDQELTVTDEDEGACKEEEDPTKDEKESETTLLPEEETCSKEETSASHAVMLLEFQGPGEALQQKRRTLLQQRSTRRVEEIKARKAGAGDQANSWSKTRSQLTSTQAKRETKSLAGGDAKQKTQPKPQPALPVCEAKLKKVGEVRICTPEQRKLDVAEMHQRTDRLYNRLEEVKQLKEIRSRQELYAKNREKAKDFHKKTLLKLRAKQTPH
ncbi:centrosomal protein of 295 kDa isoform X2 [Osmerus eperlanus]|uniref:centrosomal protein of 295 kDa isoform X2 n=1 Tax=Osmerus eperlanus TaxID=29151 RepID=UPI002E1405D0